MAAFFPLYPLLMHIVGTLLGVNYTIGGFIVSGLAYLAAIVGLFRLVRAEFDEATARRAILYISIFPSAFFLFAPFTEALFLALVVWTIALARRGRWGWAALLAFGCGMTRAQGVLIAVPLAWELFQQWRAGSRRWPALVVPTLPVAGLAAVTAFTWFTTGWTAFEVQQRWSRSYALPWNLLLASWRYIRTSGNIVEAVNLALFLIFVVLTLLGLRRIPLTYTLYVATQLLLICTRAPDNSPLVSTTRYLLVLFPAFIVLALLGRERRFHHIWWIASLVFLALLFVIFISGPFVA